MGEGRRKSGRDRNRRKDLNARKEKDGDSINHAAGCVGTHTCVGISPPPLLYIRWGRFYFSGRGGGDFLRDDGIAFFLFLSLSLWPAPQVAASTPRYGSFSLSFFSPISLFAQKGRRGVETEDGNFLFSIVLLRPCGWYSFFFFFPDFIKDASWWRIEFPFLLPPLLSPFGAALSDVGKNTVSNSKDLLTCHPKKYLVPNSSPPPSAPSPPPIP